MFGFSLAKLLFTVAVVVGVWMAFRHAGRYLAARQARDAVTRRDGGRDRATRAPEPTRNPAEPPTVDLIACPQCGRYIVRGATCACGYKDRG